MISHEYSSPAKRFLAAIAISLFLAVTFTCPQVQANDAIRATPLQLRKIMQDLGRNMQNITGAISLADWDKVAKITPQIAAHPQPPLSEKMRILAYLGADAARFRGCNEQTHEAAHAMGKAAQRGDGRAVIQSFAKVQESCLACHQSFRKPFEEHFYGQR